MFRNKWRKRTFWIWVVCIPLLLAGGVVKKLYPTNLLSTILLTIGGVGVFVGVILLKTVGRRKDKVR